MGLFTPNLEHPPYLLKYRSNTIFIVATIGIGIFSDLFLYGLVVPILPFILKDRAKIPSSEIQSYVSGLLAAYAVASVVFSPVAGIVTDKISSRRTPYLIGLSSLIAATILFYLAGNVTMLIVARLLQGASSAVVWTVGLALCIDTVGPENLGKTIGTVFSFSSVGETIAPTLGGVLYKQGGEKAVMGLSLGVLVVDLIMRLLVIEKKEAKLYYDAERKRSAQSEDEASPLLEQEDSFEESR